MRLTLCCDPSVQFLHTSASSARLRKRRRIAEAGYYPGPSHAGDTVQRGGRWVKRARVSHRGRALEGRGGSASGLLQGGRFVHILGVAHVLAVLRLRHHILRLKGIGGGEVTGACQQIQVSGHPIQSRRCGCRTDVDRAQAVPSADAHQASPSGIQKTRGHGWYSPLLVDAARQSRQGCPGRGSLR